MSFSRTYTLTSLKFSTQPVISDPLGQDNSPRLYATFSDGLNLILTPGEARGLVVGDTYAFTLQSIPRIHPYDLYDLTCSAQSFGRDRDGVHVKVDGVLYREDASVPYKSTTFTPASASSPDFEPLPDGRVETYDRQAIDAYQRKHFPKESRS